MAILKMKSTTLMETLISLLLVVLVFSMSAFLVHHFYQKGVSSKVLDLRNKANAIAYFHHFDVQDETLARIQETIPYEFTLLNTDIGFVIEFNKKPIIQNFEYVME